MRLVVIGGYSLDYLQNQVIKSFSDILSNEGLVPSWDDIYQSALKVRHRHWFVKAPFNERAALTFVP